MMDIRLKNIHKSFTDIDIVKDFNYIFLKNKITAIIGESGIGKTTLLRMISGLDNNYSGDILNVPQSISYLFQENALLPWKNVYENIHFVVRDVFSDAAADIKIKQLLKLAMLKDVENKYPLELSGGMQRRVALCRSYIYPCELMIMDEPFSGLDKKMRNKIADNFLNLVKNNTTLIISTHDEMIIDKCDYVLELHNLKT